MAAREGLPYLPAALASPATGGSGCPAGLGKLFNENENNNRLSLTLITDN
jgi:hypothetical protein